MSENAIHHLGYYYDPPSWKVCDECDRGTTNRIEPEVCTHCDGRGMVPLHYTPEQWKAAGGIVHDELPVWIQASDGKWMSGDYWEHDEGGHATDIIIATSAGKPEEE